MAGTDAPRARRAITIVAAILVAGCGMPVSVQPPATPIERPAATAAASLEPIPWSSTRRLAWNDFRAQPSVGTDAAALTATTLTSSFACSGESFGFEVTAVFYPDRSWVNRILFVQLGIERWALEHEQTHFDITEVHARRMRQFLTTLARPCDRNAQQLSELGERFLDDVADAQARYDRETLNGRDGSAQARWDADIARMLASLAAFEGR